VILLLSVLAMMVAGFWIGVQYDMASYARYVACNPTGERNASSMVAGRSSLPTLETFTLLQTANPPHNRKPCPLHVDEL
jgi:hypothetical protein